MTRERQRRGDQELETSTASGAADAETERRAPPRRDSAYDNTDWSFQAYESPPGSQLLDDGLVVEHEGREVEVGRADAPVEADADRAADVAVSRLHDGTKTSQAITGGADGAVIARSSAGHAATGSGVGSATPFDQQRGRFEHALGADLSPVRVQVGAANETAEAIGAAAFTRGAEVHVRSGHYRPGTREGDHLLAHELAHFVQGGSHQEPLRRSLVVEGKEWKYADRAAFLERMADKYTPHEHRKALHGKARKAQARHDAEQEQKKPREVTEEILKRMANNSRKFEFDDEEALERDVLMRQLTMDALDQPASCGYPDKDHGPKLSSAYWVKGEGKYDWSVKEGKEPSKAIESIFDGDDQENRLDCYTMTLAAVYKGQLDTLGDEQFDKHYPNGLNLSSELDRGGIRALEKAGVIDVVKVKGEKNLIPGDWVYSWNHADYKAKHPAGIWQGENTMCIGVNSSGEMLFRGFGIDDSTAAEVNQQLADAFNEPATAPDVPKKLRNKKIGPEDVRGPQYKTVRRPAQSALEDV